MKNSDLFIVIAVLFKVYLAFQCPVEY